MAYGQVDPARLQGDALRRWYLRSPAEIEEERSNAAAQAYNNFFSRSADGDNAARGTISLGNDLLVPGRGTGAARTEHQPAGSYQLAEAAPRGKWDYWSFRGCRSCHGYTPETLPPVGGHSPLPPSYSPRSGGSDWSSSRPKRDDRKQCEIQERRDRNTCGQQPTDQAKAVCHGTASDRRAHCDRTGEIGEPDLFTARRKSGRPWP